MRSEFHLAIESNSINPAELLASATQLSKQQIKRIMQNGAVWLETGNHIRRIRRSSRTLKVGDTIHLYYDTEIMAQQPTPAQLIADEGRFSIWYKPYGVFSQGSRWGDHCTIQRWVELHLQPQRPAISVHRLDRATTGLIIIAHQKKVAQLFGEVFQQRTINKRYRAIVEGIIEINDNGPITVATQLDGRTAITHIQPLKTDPTKAITLVDVKIDTGRKHQIRRHLAELNHPIIGDRLYGTAGEQHQDLQLTAYKLEFLLPGDERTYQYLLEPSLIPDLAPE